MMPARRTPTRAPNRRGEPLGTIHGDGSAYAVVQPFMLSRQSEGAPRTTDQPMPTQTAVHAPVLISPYYGAGSGETCKSADEPLDTVTSKGRFGMVVPGHAQQRRQPGARRLRSGPHHHHRQGRRVRHRHAGDPSRRKRQGARRRH
jgi:hypothetical protein